MAKEVKLDAIWHCCQHRHCEAQAVCADAICTILSRLLTCTGVRRKCRAGKGVRRY